MLNRIIVMGRLTRDPELRRTGSGTAVASFSIAVERDYGGQEGQKETDFLDCIAWRQTGEFVAQYFIKGRMIVVSGRLQTRSWTDKDGKTRRATEIVAENCYFGDSKSAGGSQSAPAPGGYNNAPPSSYGRPQQDYQGNRNDYHGGNNYQQQSFGGYGGGFPPKGGYREDYPRVDGDDPQFPF